MGILDEKDVRIPSRLQTVESLGKMIATSFGRWMTSWNGTKKAQDIFMIAHLINSVEKDVAEALTEKWNVNKNATSEEFFIIADKELIRLGKLLHIALKQTTPEERKSKPLGTEISGNRHEDSVSSRRLRTENLCFNCHKPRHTRRYCPTNQIPSRQYNDPRPRPFTSRSPPPGPSYQRDYQEAARHSSQQQHSYRPSSSNAHPSSKK
jgi:hypothetical protein